ncbi:MAG: S1 RNA-binding domain-containing protein, partial [Lachnospiraceae bacterium]|nr:S1 RNA-binding domain-containing protein [Lachnospiraceae bacterium]
KKARYMFGFIGETFEGVISGVSNYGIFVELPNTIEGMIRLSDLHDDYYDYDEENYRAIGQNSGREFKLGTKIKVVVKDVDEIVHTIDFLPA